MNLLLLHPDDHWLDDRSVHLDDQRAEHIRTVLKPSVGDALRAGMVGGQQGRAVITSLTSEGGLPAGGPLGSTSSSPSFRHRAGTAAPENAAPFASHGGGIRCGQSAPDQLRPGGKELLAEPPAREVQP